ncbi:ABC transporter ATP-binding protein [Granulicoccus sp. GXG6511]|uniref:ABC transporter ATP-binding protein n=1 Tax=Granulicoccus sp. GXG6511 TaxID=3381351 RepID=UPI003D7D66BD
MSSRKRPEAGPLRRTITVLRPHLKGSGRLAGLGVLAVLAEVAARLLEPWPISWVLDGVLPAVIGQPIPGGVPRLLIGAGVAVVLVAALRAGAAYLSTLAFANVGAQVTTRLRAHVHERLLGANLAFHDRMRSGDLVTRVVSDVGRVQEAGVTAGLPLAANVLTVTGMLVVVVILDPILALVVLGVLPLILVSGRFAGSRITKASRAQRKREGELAGDAGEAFAAVQTIQSYDLGAHLGARFAQANVKGLKDGVRAKRLSAALERRTDLLVGIATGAVLAIGGWRVVVGAISPGELVVFITYLKTTFKPLRDLAKHTGRIARAAASGERIADTLDEALPVQDRSWARPLPMRRPGVPGGAVRLRGVTFGYGGTPVLRGANLQVRAGERVAIVGPSGSGKSTLLNLLLRFREPRLGTVELDGHDLQDLTLASVREASAVVLQDSVIFAGDLAENVRLGRLDATDEQVEWALREAALGSLIDDSEAGIHRPVAEKGSTLSGGQRQRLAIARALLRDPRLVLLDEPTTGLDEGSRREVVAALRRLAAGRTMILVTHDEDLLADVDRVLEVRDGTFVERAGTTDRFDVEARA